MSGSRSLRRGPCGRLGVRLVDGGIFDPVPIAATYRDRTDLTVAVSLSGPPSEGAQDTPVVERAEEASGFPARRLSWAATCLSTTAHLRNEPQDMPGAACV